MTLTDIVGTPLEAGQKILWAAQGSVLFEGTLKRITKSQLYVVYRGVDWAGRPFEREQRISIDRCTRVRNPQKVIRIFVQR